MVENQNKELLEKLENLMAIQTSQTSQTLPELMQPSQPESFFDQLFPNAEPVEVKTTQEQQQEFESLFNPQPLYPNLSFQPSLNPIHPEHKTGPTATETLQQLSSLMYQNLAARGLNLYGSPTISLIRCTQVEFSKQVEMRNGKGGHCGSRATPP